MTDVTDATMDSGTAELVGLSAYCALAAMTRLSKDGDQAPTIHDHIEHMRMADRAFNAFRALELWAEQRGMEIEPAAGEFMGLFDDLEARTRPTTWWERSVKTYLMLGAFSDMLQEAAKRRDLFTAETMDWDFGENEWVEENLAPVTAADPQLAARLSLWARRVAGEALGLVRATLFTHPLLGVTPEGTDEITAVVNERHQARMAAINLKA